MRNYKGSCVLNVAIQIYFHIPSITRLPGLERIEVLKSNLDRYRVGDDPLILQHLDTIFPHSGKSRVQDVGEILTLMLSAATSTLPTNKDRWPLTTLIEPTATLSSSLQQCRSWNFQQVDGNKETLIFQVNRVDIQGRKNTTKMKYPIPLNLEKFQPAQGYSSGIHHSLKTVVVHKGNATQTGNYVVYIRTFRRP